MQTKTNVRLEWFEEETGDGPFKWRQCGYRLVRVTPPTPLPEPPCPASASR